MTMLKEDIVKLAKMTNRIKNPTTPDDWIDMIPQVVRQLTPEQYTEFVFRVLNEMNLAGVEIAGCVANEL